MFTTILARLPSVEVGIRLLYWRVAAARSAGNYLRSRLKRHRKVAVVEPAPIDFDKVITALQDAGVGQGDILVVHSSFSALKSSGLSPDAIIQRLLALVGPEGTIAMPAIPIIAHEPNGAAKFDDAAYDRVFEYKPWSRRVQTGILPATLLGLPGAARSLHPGNSMVAVGAQADQMMTDNIAGEAPTPCGPTSSWAYCWQNNAKVVALGVDLVHSLTMIHVAEDCFERSWPVAGWYRERRYRVSDRNNVAEIVVRERKHGWSQYYAERAFSRDLNIARISKTRNVDGISIHVCESKALISFLRSHPSLGYPYKFPFGLRRGRT
ncbi:MAG: AAC(3) family N-acetyltransferase [Cytophagaceae bacterium]|nr:MAG: AAC(3) family N-acetyltransferase [Cytophagaceae bacterium]